MIRQNHTFQKNHDYQRDFANSLVKSLGYNGAVQACYENQWHGVLVAVGQVKRHDQ